jgi:hypothetical protein
MFDNIKSLSKKYYKKECKRNSQCDESFSSFLEEQEKTKRCVNSNKLLYLGVFPIAYMLASIVTPLALMALKGRTKLINPTFKPDNAVVTSYYDLYPTNPTIYKSYICITTLAHSAIVLAIFTIMNQRFKVPELKQHSIRLYIMLLFGFISNCLNLNRGFLTFIKENILEIKTSLNEQSELIFLLYIFFSIFFSIYSLNVINLIKSQQIKENNWYVFKIILISCVSFSTLVYTIFLLYKNNLASVYFFPVFIANNMSYVLNMFPYFIHTLNALLTFSYFFEFRYLNTILSRNLDVDYLFHRDEEEVNKV